MSKKAPKAKAAPKQKPSAKGQCDLTNFYKHVPNPTHYDNNDAPHSLQHPAYCLLVAPSGAGKTNTLLNMLLKDNMRLAWEQAFVYCQFPDEPLYQFLREYAAEKEAKYEEKMGEPLGYPIVTITDDLSTLPTIDEARQNQSNRQVVYVFDDYMTADRKSMAKITQFYTMARKLNRGTSCIFLAQHNTKVGRTIRTACHYIVLFYHENLRERNILAADYEGDLTKEEFRKMLADVTKPQVGEVGHSLLIDVRGSDPATKYRRDIVIPIDIEKYRVPVPAEEVTD